MCHIELTIALECTSQFNDTDSFQVGSCDILKIIIFFEMIILPCCTFQVLSFIESIVDILALVFMYVSLSVTSVPCLY